MRKTIAPIALALLATAAAAQDVRQEDRREDRQADRMMEPNDVRREDRQEDRQQDRRAEANEVEAKLAVPHNADGTINETQLVNDIKAQLAAGATEIQVRGLTAQDAKTLIASNPNLLADLAKLLPNDGVERQVRLRGAVDARIQRNDEGELRARIEGIDLGTLTPAQRADLARQLATQAGLDRLRIRGTDANGARVRVEFRDDRGIVKNEGRADRNAARGNASGNRGNGRERVARMDRPERAERAERAERVDRVERVERPERVDRPERAERADRVERVERPDRSGRH
ncbi:MAG TPA: hypothetical protein VGF58_01045 [Burkholderiales bacterium]|jgi:hypothetical protein